MSCPTKRDTGYILLRVGISTLLWFAVMKITSGAPVILHIAIQANHSSRDFVALFTVMEMPPIRHSTKALSNTLGNTRILAMRLRLPTL